MEDRVMSQEMQVASGSWKRQGNRFSPGASKRNQPCHHFDLSPVKLTLDFWPPELKENTFVLI